MVDLFLLLEELGYVLLCVCLRLEGRKNSEELDLVSTLKVDERS